MMIPHMKRLLGIILLASCTAFAQVKEGTQTKDRTMDLQQSASALLKEDLSSKISGTPMDGPISPDRYIVGPADVFELGVWGPFGTSYPLTVTPEGTVIIPTVGEVTVAGMKLSDVKKKIFEKVRTKYIAGDVTFTLLKPRSIVVTLRGSVLRQGQYVVTSVDRVEKLLNLGANIESSRPNLTFQPGLSGSPDGIKEDYVRPAKVAQTEEIYDRASLRNITLLRKKGDTVRVDIPMFYATGEDRFNPYLVDGDVVLVPQRLLLMNAVGVYGAVNAPGQYEWVEGDNVRALIQIAQGAMKIADLSKVVVQRVNERGEKVEEMHLNLLADQSGQQNDITLQRGDRIIVPLVPEDRGVYAVTVTGRVQKPGMYPILRHGTRLSQILTEAGGFKNDALLSGAVLLRRDEQGGDLFGSQVSMLRNLRSQQLTVADSAYFYLDLRTGRHQVVVDFARLVLQRDTTQDVLLSNEDMIHIPSNSQTVLVHGQVQRPGYVPFVAGMKFKDYLEKAGGYSDYALSGDAKVIKRATLEWLDPGDTVIEPGDQIWVPKDVILDSRQKSQALREYIGVIASVATTVLIAIQVLR